MSCGQLTNSSNGRVNTSAGTSFGDTAMYSCDTGYMLNGPAERECKTDGQWSGSEPTCESESDWISFSPYLQLFVDLTVLPYEINKKQY